MRTIQKIITVGDVREQKHLDDARASARATREAKLADIKSAQREVARNESLLAEAVRLQLGAETIALYEADVAEARAALQTISGN